MKNWGQAFRSKSSFHCIRCGLSTAILYAKGGVFLNSVIGLINYTTFKNPLNELSI